MSIKRIGIEALASSIFNQAIPPKTRLLQKLSVSLIIFLICFAPVQSDAATKNKQNGKEKLVLMPLRLDDDLKQLQGSLESALVEGLNQKYVLFSGERVAQKAHAIFLKETRIAGKTECDETRCMQKIAGAFQAELIAVANVTKKDGGYFIALSIQNIFDNKAVFSRSLACERCTSFQLIDKLKEVSKADSPFEVKPTQYILNPEASNTNNLNRNDLIKESTNCYISLSNDPDLARIKSKVGLSGPVEQTFEMKANKTFPTTLDKKTIKEWVGKVHVCANILEDALTAGQISPEMANLIKGIFPKFEQRILQLFDKKITYGEFAHGRDEDYSAFMKEAEEIKQKIAQQLEETRRQEQERRQEQRDSEQREQAQRQAEYDRQQRAQEQRQAELRDQRQREQDAANRKCEAAKQDAVITCRNDPPGGLYGGINCEFKKSMAMNYCK